MIANNIFIESAVFSLFPLQFFSLSVKFSSKVPWDLERDFVSMAFTV